MEQQDKIRLLLSMQEHPEQYTEEQLHRMLADDSELTELLEKLSLTKQALVKREADEEAVPVEEEWKKFADEYADEIDTLGKDERHTSTIKRLMGRLPYKVVASIIGIIFTAGIAFAAIHIVRMVGRGKSQIVQTAEVSPNTTASVAPIDTIKTDSIINSRPVVFDNVPLEKMLTQIATFYHKDVEFLNGDALHLRFYFVWKQDETLDVVLHRLNLFESINIELKSDKIVIE